MFQLFDNLVLNSQLGFHNSIQSQKKHVSINCLHHTGVFFLSHHYEIQFAASYNISKIGVGNI